MGDLEWTACSSLLKRMKLLSHCIPNAAHYLDHSCSIKSLTIQSVFAGHKVDAQDQVDSESTQNVTSSKL
jgi:hypothetical protein